MAKDDCFGDNFQEDAQWIRFIWASVFIGINITIFIVTVVQMCRSRGLFKAYSTHKVKITTRFLNCLISVLCIALSVLDLDTWIFSPCPPRTNTVYMIYNFLKIVTEGALCIAAVALAYNLFRSYFRGGNNNNSNSPMSNGHNAHNHTNSSGDIVNEKNYGSILLPPSMKFGWPILCILWILNGIVCLLVAYLPFLQYPQAIVIYVDIRQLLAAFGFFYFSFCVFLLKQQGKVSFGSNTTLGRLYYGLIVLGVLSIVSCGTLTYSTIDSWNDWNVRNVTYYSLQDYDGYQYFVVLVFLLISWFAYWLVMLAIIKQVYTRRNQHAFMSQRGMAGTATQSIDMY